MRIIKGVFILFFITTFGLWWSSPAIACTGCQVCEELSCVENPAGPAPICTPIWVTGSGCGQTNGGCPSGSYNTPSGECRAIGAGSGGGGGGGGGEDTMGGNCGGGYTPGGAISTFCSADYKDTTIITGNALQITGCCNNMKINEDGDEVCGGGNYQYTSYACVPICVPSCGSPSCGQSDGCGGTCASWDQGVWGAWGACNVSCGGGIQTKTNACGNLQGQTCNTQSCQGPWWQVKDGDLTASGDIISKMPAGYYFDTIGNGGFPGVPVYRDQIAVVPGTISTKLWNANTATEEMRVFNYSYFDNLIPDDVVSGQLYSDGYRWEMITGNHTLPTTNFGATKNILFVNGNLTIDGNLNLDDDLGFFLAIVKGTITINPAVTEIEGIYETDAGFATGVGTTQLKVRGSVVSYGGITMQRDLPDDTLTPAELFEFAPDQILLYPDKLGFRGTRWSEVAP